jgi:hypothetical protein
VRHDRATSFSLEMRDACASPFSAKGVEVMETGMVTSPDAMESKLKRSLDENEELVRSLKDMRHNLTSFKGVFMNQVKDGLSA